MSSASSLYETFVGALQGTVSVLLTLLAGYVVAKQHLLTRNTVKHISKLCTALFLPCLIIVQMGPELTVANLSRVWIIPLWGLVSSIFGHLIGWVGQRALGLKHWTIVACGRPNANALPLLLLQSLVHTGVLNFLAGDGEKLSDTLDRAKSLLLLNAVVQQTFTFQLAPAVLARDDGHRAKQRSFVANRLQSGPGHTRPVVQDPERVGLLHEHNSASRGITGSEHDLSAALGPIQDMPDVHWPSCLYLLEQPVKKAFSYISPPLTGAIIALAFGIISPLHEAFLSEDGRFYTSITQSVKNLGDLFVVLQTFTVGAELALVPSTHPGYLSTSWVLVVRFLVMPALSLLFVWGTAGRGWYVDDPLVWFILVLIPAGPSAMLLVSVAELVNVDQGPIAGYLTISYLISPLMAAVCSLGLTVVRSVQDRSG
ncbi:hypothetical protein AcV7_004563 [Taiwanofungus camphoratus]|nr:hypothetical protein AcV7_004563 [Antrodia cinnamomea]